MNGEDRRVQERRLDRGSWVAVAGAVIVVLMVAATLVLSVMATDNTNELTFSSKQQACMSKYNARKDKAERLVTVTKEQQDHDVRVIEDLRDDLYLRAQVAAATDDRASLESIIDQAPEVLDQLAEARKARDAAVAEVRQKSDDRLDDYNRAATLRDSDPEEFLEVCRRELS